jgi:tetratricopeptide (TPR) repeat protein
VGRFSNLEFESHEEGREESRPGAARDEQYYLALATDEYRSGRFEDALRDFSRALEFASGRAEGWLGQVQALIELDEPREARLWADKGLEQFRGHPDLTAAKGVACGRLGDLDAAMALSDAALAEKGEGAYRWRARGDVLLARRDRNEEFCFDKALAAAGRDAFEPLAIGRIYMHYGRWATAVRHLESAVERNSRSAFAWECFGTALEHAGLTERARQAYRSASELDPSRARGAAERLEGGALAGLWGAIRRLFGRP